MKTYEVIGRVAIISLGLYFVFKSFSKIFSQNNYVGFGALDWIIYIAVFLVGLFLIYRPLKGVFFRKR